MPGAAELGAQAQGILVIPNIRKLGFFASGAYGEGALLIGPAKVDYYSMSAAGFGLTFGAAEFNQALFFMTAQALQDFRVADGWELGVDAAVRRQAGRRRRRARPRPRSTGRSPRWSSVSAA